MIINTEARNISGTLKLEHEKYTVTEGNLIKLIQQAICTYNHPEMSVIREYAVNGRDAMKLHGIDKPIEVTTPTSLSPKLTIRDYGGGMTEEETRSLLFSFGASGQEKQTSNRYVGGFGIGSKSAFNLSDSFLFCVFHKGVKTIWQCMRDKENFPTAAKMSSVETTEQDGVLVVIPSKPFNEEEAINALRWLDVPVVLNGKPVKSYKAESQMSGTTKFLSKNGDEVQVKWDIVPKSSNRSGDLTFLVGCGAVYTTVYRLPREATIGVSIPGYFSGKFIIELPIGSVDLMTSREDFIYNDKTNYVLRKAMQVAVEDAHNKLMSRVYEATDVRAMIDRLAELRVTYDGFGFNTVVNSCLKRVRENTNLEEMKAEICRELEISEKTGIDMALVSYPFRNSRRYCGDYRYKTSNAASEGFDGNGLVGGPNIWRATNENMWKDSFLSEFSELAKFGTGDNAKVIVAAPTMFDNEKNAGVPRLIFEALNWKGMKIHVYPRNTKKFIGRIREYLATFGKSVSKTAPIILTLCGDIDLIKEHVVNLFPGAEVTYHTDVETFKLMHKRVSKTGRKVISRKLWGWIVKPTVKHIDFNNPEDIVYALLKHGVNFAVSNKTSFMDYENAKKPIFYINLEDARNRMNDNVLYDLRFDVINLLLGNADVMKDDKGMPVIAFINMPTGAPDIGVPFATGGEIANKMGKVNTDINDRHAIWMYRMLCGDKGEAAYREQDLISSGNYIRRTGLYTYDATVSELKCGAKMLEYLFDALRGKRLAPTLRKAIDTVELLFTRPAKMPYIPSPGFSAELVGGSSRFITAYKTLFSGMPVAKTFMGQLTLSDNRRPEWLKDAARNLAALLINKSKLLATNKEVPDDNKQ